MAGTSAMTVLTNILVAPSEAFAAIRERPSAWLPLLASVLGTVMGVVLMQLVRATLIKHNLPDSIAQMIQAAIIVAAVYVARERR